MHVLLVTVSLAAIASFAVATPHSPIPMQRGQLVAVANVARASGTFEVKLTPQANGVEGDSKDLGRLTIDKTFRGDLSGTSHGQMLTAITPVKGSAGYVAIERFTGSLHGKRGSFVLQHNGLMDRDAQQLTIVVVPDSGTDDLTGITGSMTISITEGKHLYVLEYTLENDS